MIAILDYLKSIKLTLAEWAGVTAAAVIGVLIAALKVQGSRLHKAQNDLLKQQYDFYMATANEKANAAKAKYESSLQQYLKAGGKL